MLSKKPATILVIDDEKDVLRVVELNLRSAGFEVITVSNGRAGIKAAKEHKPNLILLDVMMPEMSGLEVLMELKWDKKLKKIPVIMLTAKSTVGDMDHAFNRRADGYITKPFDGEKLGETIMKKMIEISGKELVHK
jgi:DNA-binding response OmpR family regulator